MYEFAKQLRDGSLKYEDTSAPGFAAEHLLPRLVDVVLQRDEDKALDTLGFILEGEPRLLWLPAVQSQFRHLFFDCGYWDAPQDFRDRVKDWLIRLIVRWAKGMTGGYNVSITKPKGRKGVAPSLFPNLEERDGYFPTERAYKERDAATILRRSYDDLMDRLKQSIEWKRVRREYQERLDNGEDRMPVVDEVASDIRPAFENFQRDWGISGGSLSEESLLVIVREGLDVRKGGNPRHKIACRLLGQINPVIDGAELKTSPSLIESTLDTLRKHGIGARSRVRPSRPTRKQRRRPSR